MGDHDVDEVGHHLEGRRVALVVTGGIAAYRAPDLARALRRQGADVVPFLTSEGARYVASDALEWASRNRPVTGLSADAEHLSDDARIDAYLVAPATYNTINKMAAGIADTPATAALASGLGRMERGEAQVLVAPTMHGSMHTSILTESLERLDRLGVRVIPPREDYGKHNIPSHPVLVAEVARALSTSPLRGAPILVTGGPTPVPLDNVRRIVNRFRGRLGALVTEELYLRGADVHLIHGDGAYQPPEHLPVTVVKTYDQYRRGVAERLSRGVDGRPYRAGIFSAAVADYAPRDVRPGKTPSGETGWTVKMEPTAKVIEEVRDRFPDLYSLVFKYQEGVSLEELAKIARGKIELGFPAVVANRGEEMGAGDEQVAYLFTREGIAAGREPLPMEGKRAIARALADHLETVPAVVGAGGVNPDAD
jgi:phosphopantothenoylcysteine decarboxylase/phosphopantothenate--cysteine ligase